MSLLEKVLIIPVVLVITVFALNAAFTAECTVETSAGDVTLPDVRGDSLTCKQMQKYATTARTEEAYDIRLFQDKKTRQWKLVARFHRPCMTEELKMGKEARVNGRTYCWESD